MSSRLKLLISAYACSPYQGSEPGVGWGFVAELAKHHDLWVIVEEEKFQEHIERYVKEHPEFPRSVRFHFIRKQRNRVLRKLWPPSYYWYYRRWHKDAFLLAQQLHKEVGFDIAHQLTMVGFREPGYLWQLDVPFVWGPVGGFGILPWRFFFVLGWYGAAYYLGYNIFNSFHMRYMNRPKIAAVIAGNGLISMSSENRLGIKKYYDIETQICVPVGPPTLFTNRVRIRAENEPLRIVWAGLHIQRKALNIGLRSMALLPDNIDWELHILGTGDLENKWKKLTIRLGLGTRCKFYGQVTRAEVLRVMSNSHIHLFTSLREGTPSVIAEASALGIPTICLDLAGMSDMVVNGHSGIKIPPQSSNYVAGEMAKAIEKLSKDEELRLTLAKNALESANNLSWREKINFLNDIYYSKVGKS